MKRFFAATNFVVAVGLLLAISARTAVADDVKISSDGGIVVPDNIYERQPFSFAAPQIAQGEVVSVQSVGGEVVRRAATDKYGRVFLAAGLPAGAYLISRSSHDQPIGKIEIHQRAADALDLAGQHAAQPMQLTGSPQFAKISESTTLTGHGFNPNAAEMQVSVSASGQTHTLQVLAATEDQLKLAPVTQLSPGIAQLRITNNGTGESTGSRQLLLYDADGRLGRRKLTSGEQTAFEVHTRPEDVPMKVRAMISGQATFSGGRSEAETITDRGLAVFPVQADRGAGPFRVSWEATPAAAAEEQPTEAVPTGFHAQQEPSKAGVGEKVIEKLIEELAKKLVDEGWEFGKGGVVSQPSQPQDGGRHSCSTGPVSTTFEGYGEAKAHFFKQNKEDEDSYAGQLQEEARQKAHEDLSTKVGKFLASLKCDPPCKCYAIVTYGDYYWEGHSWYSGTFRDTLSYWSRQSATVMWGCKE